MNLKPCELRTVRPREDAQYDVIVAGSGPAGIGAALAAASNGASVLLLEARSAVGGTASAALWMCINRLFVDGERRGGIPDLFVDKIESMGALASAPGKTDIVNGDNLDVHPEYLKLAVLELLDEYGVAFQLYSPVTGVVKAGNRLQGVTITGRGGEQTFHGSVVIDATGDGDVAYLAGCEMVSGREEDGKTMPISLVFAVANVDETAFDRLLAENTSESLAERWAAAAAAGYCMTKWYGFDRTTIPGVISVNNGGSWFFDLDGVRSDDLTTAEYLGLRLAVDFVRYCRDHTLPGLADIHLLRTGAYAAVRETRRLVGEYVLTEEDALTGTDFPDTVARKYGAIDSVYRLETFQSGFGYPYRSFLPKTIDGLLVAGRCGSATHIGHAAGKSMGNMMDLGQAAGTAAALCAIEGICPRDINVAQLQDRLRAMGSRI